MKAKRSTKVLLRSFLVVYTMILLALTWHYRQHARAERARTYAVAAGMERLLSLLHPSAEGSTLAALRTRSDVLVLEEFPKDARSFLRDGQRAFTVVFSSAEPSRNLDLRRYFADTVLAGYYYAVVDKQGALVDFFWDKP
jgi:hypothetical protein